MFIMRRVYPQELRGDVVRVSHNREPGVKVPPPSSLEHTTTRIAPQANSVLKKKWQIGTRGVYQFS